MKSGFRIKQHEKELLYPPLKHRCMMGACPRYQSILQNVVLVRSSTTRDYVFSTRSSILGRKRKGLNLLKKFLVNFLKVNFEVVLALKDEQEA